MSELHEFINQDVASWYPDLIPHIKLTLVEAGPGILGSFDKALSEYYLKELEKKNIDVRLNTAVAGVDERYIEGEQVTNKLIVLFHLVISFYSITFRHISLHSMKLLSCADYGGEI